MRMNDFYITGTRRGLGEALSKFYDTVDTLEECDVFINCKHDGFQQVELLYEAAELDKRIINIGFYYAFNIYWTTRSRKRHTS